MADIIDFEELKNRKIKKMEELFERFLLSKHEDMETAFLSSLKEYGEYVGKMTTEEFALVVSDEISLYRLFKCF